MDTDKSGINFKMIERIISYYRAQKSELFPIKGVQLQQDIELSENHTFLTEWLNGIAPEMLVPYLEPIFIKQRIEKTIERLKREKISNGQLIIEKMSPDEYKSGKLSISYHFYNTDFGEVIIASTGKGVCYVGFTNEDQSVGLKELQRRFPGATYTNCQDHDHRFAIAAFTEPSKQSEKVRLHLKGTSFQLNLWMKLLQIPVGGLVSYTFLAGNKENARAIGKAVGDNPIAYLIPCHRVVRADGTFNQYYWGPELKAALIARELATVLAGDII
ncbi:methylated-DNA--[protein]-cysteine S-methyltransferase [Mucilaginibacter sp. cycad4]|uniref:methylated-DNA--[protein]-cysteine S-methyltransferase n=1 Tax=Mucilaginibacter sp. cycad4 TaxID=3342096 RepID=UPI002AAC4B0E|nr:methylated-DNA--[protein]-cysteine S-methyltransferase [Mucilaginibacter gossypii]WPV02123.1 methylated-DNA--[protein]-cysteine S-methyltransferase [Mucilaginibacter gossypii]